MEVQATVRRRSCEPAPSAAREYHPRRLRSPDQAFCAESRYSWPGVLGAFLRLTQAAIGVPRGPCDEAGINRKIDSGYAAAGRTQQPRDRVSYLDRFDQ